MWKKFFLSENNSTNINNSYINCIDENLAYNSYIIQNDSSYPFELNTQFITYNSIETGNRTEIIQHIINNLISIYV